MPSLISREDIINIYQINNRVSPLESDNIKIDIFDTFLAIIDTLRETVDHTSSVAIMPTMRSTLNDPSLSHIALVMFLELKLCGALYRDDNSSSLNLHINHEVAAQYRQRLINREPTV